MFFSKGLGSPAPLALVVAPQVVSILAWICLLLADFLNGHSMLLESLNLGVFNDASASFPQLHASPSQKLPEEILTLHTFPGFLSLPFKAQ